MHFLSNNDLKNKSEDFKWKHFSHEIILWAVRWYCQFALSYRDLVWMLEERGLSICHTTMMRWVHEYASKLEKRVKRLLKPTNDSWRVDETYIKIKGKWFYLYRAVDSDGNTLDWMLSETRDKKAAASFLKALISLSHSVNPRVINTDKNAAYRPAFENCKDEKSFCKETKLRQVKYLNNVIEQDHRFVKRRVKNSLWLQSFRTAKSTIAGYETMHMIRKGQIEHLCKNDPINQIKFIDNLFGVAA